MLNALPIFISATVMAVLYVMAPERLNEKLYVATAVVLSASSGLVVWTPKLLSLMTGQATRHDAKELATLGPAAFFGAIVFIIALSAYGFAYFRVLKYAEISLILVGAVVGVGAIILASARSVVEHSSLIASAPSRHAAWSAALDVLAARCTDVKTRTELEKLTEAFKFASDDSPKANFEADRIDVLIESIRGQVTSHECSNEVNRKILELRALLAERESAIKASRSQI